MDSFVERQHLCDYLPTFPDTCGPSRIDTTIKSPVKGNSCHSTPNLVASSPDSGIPQSSPQTLHSFKPESPVITSQPTTPRILSRTSSTNPTNLPSTSTGTTPRSRKQTLYEKFLAIGTEKHTSKFSLIFHISTSFSIYSQKTQKNTPSHSKQILSYSTHL